MNDKDKDCLMKQAKAVHGDEGPVNETDPTLGRRTHSDPNEIDRMIAEGGPATE